MTERSTTPRGDERCFDLKPDAKGFAYVLMWMDHLLEHDQDADPSYVLEWRVFVEACRSAMLSETALTDEKGRPMTYWGGVAPSAEGARSENADMWRLHAQSFDAFLGELYAIMVDPCAEGTIKRDDMMQALKDAAVRDREASEKHQSDPKNINLAALVLKFNKHISLHEMFASEWEAIVAAARAMPSATVNATASTTAKR